MFGIYHIGSTLGILVISSCYFSYGAGGWFYSLVLQPEGLESLPPLALGKWLPPQILPILVSLCTSRIVRLVVELNEVIVAVVSWLAIQSLEKIFLDFSLSLNHFPLLRLVLVLTYHLIPTESLFFLSCLCPFFPLFFFFLKMFMNLYWICYNIACFMLLFFLPECMWDLSSPTRDRTCIPWIGMQSLNHWTTSEVPLIWFCDC